MKILRDKDIFQNPEFFDKKTYKERVTVKAIIKNQKNNKFAFVTNKVHNYILLVGGGAESNNLENEIDRESQEEIFYSIKNIKKLYEIREFRNRNAKKYQTICYYGEINKKVMGDRRTEDEKNNDLKVVWFEKNTVLKIMKEQVKKVGKGEVRFYNTAFNIVRDYEFLITFFKEVEK